MAPIHPLSDWLSPSLLTAVQDAGRGRRLHLVGGALRDRLLGHPPLDLDLVSPGRGEALGRRLADALGGRFIALGGERFAAYRIVTGELVVDLWGRGTQPIESDLERRDLTINSLAVDLHDETLLDPFDGRTDLERRVLRATTAYSFDDDPLRVLRLARFAATLAGFSAVPDTLALARQTAPLIFEVADERVRDEVTKILASRGRGRGLKTLSRTGLYPLLWGGAETAIEPTEALAAVEPLIASYRQRLAPNLWACDATVVSQALLFCPPGGGTAAAADSPLLARQNRRRVLDLLALGDLPVTEKDGRCFLRSWGRHWLEAVIFSVLRPRAAPGSASVNAAADRLERLARRLGRQVFDLRPLLDGEEVGRLLGIEAGPQIGAALRAIEREQVLGRVRSAAEARQFLRRWQGGD